MFYIFAPRNQMINKNLLNKRIMKKTKEKGNEIASKHFNGEFKEQEISSFHPGFLTNEMREQYTSEGLKPRHLKEVIKDFLMMYNSKIGKFSPRWLPNTER